MEPEAPIRVFTLSRLRVLKDGQPLTENGDAQRRPLDLLKVLIALGGDGIPEEQICEALWPDSDGDAAKSTLGATLHRLRGIVGRDAVRLKQGRISLDARHCWVDALAFGQQMDALARALDAGKLPEAQEAIQAALPLYRGPFLEGEFEPSPILAARERLHSQFLRHLTRLGESLTKANQHSEAARLFQAGLEADPVSEELAQHLLRALQRQGRLSEALTAYKRFRDQLRGSLGIDPSPESETLHREIQATARELPPPEAQPSAASPIVPTTSVTPLSPASERALLIAAPAISRSPRIWLALAALVLVSAGISAWVLTRPPTEPVAEGLPLPDKPSIAVMPFENLSGDPGQEYFSDGITETLITDLSRLSGLFVIARDSTFTYKGKNVDVRQVGRELGVKYVLEGSVQRSGQRVRINTQLIDAQSNTHLWAERFDREFRDIFAVQDEITRTIVTELNTAS